MCTYTPIVITTYRRGPEVLPLISEVKQGNITSTYNILSEILANSLREKSYL